MMFILMFSNFHLIIPSPLMEWWLNQKEPTNDTTLESTNAYTTRFNRKWIWFCRIRSVLQRQTRAENADQQCKVSTIRLPINRTLAITRYPPSDISEQEMFLLVAFLFSRDLQSLQCSCNGSDHSNVSLYWEKKWRPTDWVRKTKPTVFCLAVMDGVATMAAMAQWSMAILFWPI